ncbi:hypothetical protein YC2023_110434 [Brassica napus]
MNCDDPYSDIKERIKKTKDEKKAKKAEFASKQQKIQANIPKAAAKEGPKLGGEYSANVNLSLLTFVSLLFAILINAD